MWAVWFISMDRTFAYRSLSFGDDRDVSFTVLRLTVLMGLEHKTGNMNGQALA